MKYLLKVGFHLIIDRCALFVLIPPFLSLCLKSGFELHYMV